MTIYRSKYDPYDVDRKQPYETITVGGVRIRIFRNETFHGLVWKFDVVGIVPRRNTDELSRGIPLEEAPNLVTASQALFEWQALRLDTRSNARQNANRNDAAPPRKSEPENR